VDTPTTQRRSKPLLINEFCRLAGRPRKGPFWLVRRGHRYLYATAFEEGLTEQREFAWPFDSKEEAEGYALTYKGKVVRVAPLRSR